MASARLAKVKQQLGKSQWTSDEVAKHNKVEDCWVIIKGKVYDVTDFLPNHPGGKKAIINYAGKDATDEFEMLHEPGVLSKNLPPEACMGDLVGGGGGGSSPATDNSTPGEIIDTKAFGSLRPSATQSRLSGGTANILPEERKRASFNVTTLTNFLDGGKAGTAKRRWILEPLEERALGYEQHNMPRGELMQKAIDNFIQIHKPFGGKYIPTTMETNWMSVCATNSGPIMPHFSLFLLTLVAQANDEQQFWWLTKAIQLKIIGCYAQTELGHGSNVRGLQTIAEYDRSTQQFVLNTPTLQSVKWWNSGLGKVATHACVYAQLLIDGKEHGVNVFMLQLRDQNHHLLPGIEAGDCGNKMGDHALDTGYLKLTDVRVPREYMLSRYQEVQADGTYVSKKKAGSGGSKTQYYTMMRTRASMIWGSGGSLARACTIAVRYSAVRRQGFTESTPGSYQSIEHTILDYNTQRYRLFKQLSLAYCVMISGTWLHSFVEKGMSGAELDDNLLGEMHPTVAGLKGLCCYLASDGIEECRKACGGHGFLMNNGIAPLWLDYVWKVTAEGDWMVMLLQSARQLIKAVDGCRSGKPVTAICDYLLPLKAVNSVTQLPRIPTVPSVDQFCKIPYLIELFKFRSMCNVFSAWEQYTTLQRKGMSHEQAWNACSVDLALCARYHTYFFMLKNFHDTLPQIEDIPVRNVLSKVCLMFGLSEVIDGNWGGVLDFSQLALARAGMRQLLEELRPEAVALVDAFDFPDCVLNSTLGRHDGNVYEALFEAAQYSPLNKVEVFEGYPKVLQPHLDLEFLSLKNKVPKM